MANSSGKTSKAKQKIEDITRVDKDAAATAAQKLVIQNRSRIERPTDTAEIPADPVKTAPAVPVDAAATTASSPASTPTATPASGKVTIKPVSESLEPAPQEDKAPEPETKPVTTDTSSTSNTTTQSPAQPATKSDEVITDDIDTLDPNDATADKTQSNKDVKKALEDARREDELQEYIDTRKFFVPIDAQARKKSVRSSLWLTLLYVFLSIVLVDLMLDSGMIYLIHHIPHTNFFGLN